MSAVLQLVPTHRAHRAVVRPPQHRLEVSAAVTRHRRIAACLPGTAVRYPVTSDAERGLLVALAAAGCGFVATTPAEVVVALRAGAAPGDLVYSQPAASRQDLAFTARLGVRVFTVDSVEQTRRVAAAAPRAAVLCRIAASGDRSSLPLPGCDAGKAVHVLRAAAALGLAAAGTACHVDAARPEPWAWDSLIAASARVFSTLRAAGPAPWLLDLGGAFPARGDTDGLPLPAYGAGIETSLRRHFGDNRPAMLVEPGPAVLTDARLHTTTPEPTRLVGIG